MARTASRHLQHLHAPAAATESARLTTAEPASLAALSLPVLDSGGPLAIVQMVAAELPCGSVAITALSSALLDTVMKLQNSTRQDERVCGMLASWRRAMT